MSEVFARIARPGGAAAGPLWILGGRVVHALCQFVALAAVSRLAGTEALGQVILGLAIAVPVFALFGGQWRLVLATDGEERLSFRAVERLGLAGHVAGMTAFVAIAACFRFDLAEWTTLLGVGLARASESWTEIAFGRLQRRGAFAAIGISTALKSLLGTATIAALLATTGSVGLAFAASGAIWLATATLVDRRFARAIVPAADSPIDLRDPLRRAAPLSAAATLSTFDSQLPRYAVESALGTRALGLFGPMHYAALAILTFVIPLTYAQTPALADDVARRDRASFRRRAGKGLVAATLLGTGFAFVAWLGSPILAWAFGEERLGEGWTFPLLLIAATIQAPAAVLETALRALHGFRSLMLIQFVTLLAHAGACAVGLLWFGLDGVAGAMIARSVVCLALLACAGRSAERRVFGTAAIRDASLQDASDLARRVAA